MEIIKNYLKYSLWFVLIVFAALLGLHWLPVLTIDGHTMRRVDLLSDLRYPESEIATADSDSIPLPPVVKPVFVDTCRAGMTCIEDYSDSTLRGMAPFMKHSIVSLPVIQMTLMTNRYALPYSETLLSKRIYLQPTCAKCFRNNSAVVV